MKNLELTNELRLCCPVCPSSELVIGEESLNCSKCSESYLKKDGKYYFVNYDESPTYDSLDKIKTIFKKYPKLYGFLKDTVSPLYFKNDLSRFISNNNSSGRVLLNLGSGNFSIGDNVLNVDLIAYDNVDIVSSLEKLPFCDNSVDGIIINSVLEHVPNADLVVDEMFRVLKPGGRLFASVPFICGFHASPYDYTRWTREGVKVLFKKFEMTKLYSEGGPSSALLWVFQEWFATLFSFGSKNLFNLNYLLIMLLTWPFKYLDIFMTKFPTAHHINSCFIFEGRKK
ncbi:class I SAM-dependent methyltransferase [Halobacteriovorax sp. HLS]|uniref:class I SAM-dependent methyltransferase n=1 Tax=Halobacteriovorax sp. HLS TaxID=2234000 RepID=UPI000FD9BEA1|nr:class I SAM-dependent methyltransferase [Halobacteriovorax sp. HLS]